MSDKELIDRLNYLLDDLVILFGPLGGADPKITEIPPSLLAHNPDAIEDVIMYRVLNKAYKQHPEWFTTVFE